MMRQVDCELDTSGAPSARAAWTYVLGSPEDPIIWPTVRWDGDTLRWQEWRP